MLKFTSFKRREINLVFKIKVFVVSKIWYFNKSIYFYFPKIWVVTKGAVPGDEGALFIGCPPLQPLHIVFRGADTTYREKKETQRARRPPHMKGDMESLVLGQSLKQVDQDTNETPHIKHEDETRTTILEEQRPFGPQSLLSPKRSSSSMWTNSWKT
jgi:hypothetical protein